MKTAVFAGSFNPFTKGHFQVVNDFSYMFDTIIILVASNEEKQYAISPEGRKLLIELSLQDLNGTTGIFNRTKIIVDVLPTGKTTVDYAALLNAAMIRGLRDSNDFSYERNLSLVNKTINKGVPTYYTITKDSFISSSAVRSLIQLYGYNYEILEQYLTKNAISYLEKCTIYK